MSRGRRAISGFLTDSGGQVLLTLVNFLVTPLMLHRTSEAKYGFWLTASSAIAYLGLFEMGFGTALLRAVAATPPHDSRRLNVLVSTTLVTLSAAGFAVLAIGMAVSPFVPHWFGISPGDSAEVVAAFRIVAVATALGIPASIFTSVLCGRQHMAVDNLSRVAVTAISWLLIVFLLHRGWGLLAMAWATLFTVVGTAIAEVILTFRFAPELRLSPRHFDREAMRGLGGFGGYFQIGKVANAVVLNGDNLAISSILGANAVTPYALTARLPLVFSFTLASKVPSATLAAISQMYAQGEMGPLRSAYIKLSSYSTRLAIVGVTACVLANHDLVRLWVGNAQYGGALLTGVFCIRIFQEANIRGTGGVLLATGRIRAWALASIVETLLTAILLVVLVRAYGLVGAALGSLLGRTLTIAWIVPWLVCRAIGLPISRYVMEGIVQPALWSLPGALAVVAIVSLISVPVSWPYLAALMILCFGANALCFEGRQWIRSFSNAES